MKTVSPIFLQDRTDLAQVALEYPDFVSDLSQSHFDILKGRPMLQFCGIVSIGDTQSFVVLPRKSFTGVPHQDLDTARLTMRVLTRFGRDMKDRLGASSGDSDVTSRLSLSHEIAVDFIQYGIFHQRTLRRARSSGKPNWINTISKETALFSADGTIVYPEIRTTRSRDSHDSLLTQVQVAVLLEISRLHGWWIDGLSGREDELSRFNLPHLARELWSTHLRLLLPELYASRAVTLANSLIAYLSNTSATSPGLNYYGIDDFHVVWEHMLRNVLRGVEAGWNSRLPRPAYFYADGSFAVQERGLQTDIVLRTASGDLYIIDAKYYDASAIGQVPGSSDIIKQLFYDLAVSSVTADLGVRNCFLFPSSRNESPTFTSIKMLHRDGSSASTFPIIDCFYLDIIEVMQAFSTGRKINFPSI